MDWPLSHSHTVPESLAINKIMIENREHRIKNIYYLFVDLGVVTKIGSIEYVIALKSRYNNYSYVAPHTTLRFRYLQSFDYLDIYWYVNQHFFLRGRDIYTVNIAQSDCLSFFCFFFSVNSKTAEIETALANDLISLNNFHFNFYCHLFRSWTELYGKTDLTRITLKFMLPTWIDRNECEHCVVDTC